MGDGSGITCLVGRAKVGKSYITLHLAHSLATGEPLFGHFAVRQSRVCILTKEDPRNLIARRLRELNYESDLPILFSDDQTAYCNSESQLNRIIDFAQQNQADTLIIDSLIRVIGGDENASKDVTKVHHFFKELNQAGITVIFIHHQGKEDSYRNGQDRLRGSSDLSAMVDSILAVKKRQKDVLVITQEALRQDEAVQPFEIEYPSFKFLEHISDPLTDQNTIRTSADQAETDVLSAIQESPEPIKQRVVIDKLKEQGVKYGTSTAKNAFRKLELSGDIIGIQQGRDKLYQLADRTTGQTPLAFDPLSDSQSDVAGGAVCS